MKLLFYVLISHRDFFSRLGVLVHLTFRTRYPSICLTQTVDFGSSNLLQDATAYKLCQDTCKVPAMMKVIKILIILGEVSSEMHRRVEVDF